MLCALRNIIRKHGGLPLAGTRREVAHMIMQRGVGNCNAGCTPALPLHVHVRLQLNTGAGRVTAPTVPALLTLFCFFHGLLMRKTFPIRLTDLWRLTIRSWFLIILFYKHSFLRLLFNVGSYNYELPAQNVKLNIASNPKYGT